MKYFNMDDLKTLLEKQGNPCVSIFLPMARRSDQTQKNPIRYKNAVKKVEKQMEEAGYDVREIREMVSRLNEAADGYEFFQDQLDGLAVFLADDFLQMIKLPVRMENRVDVKSTLEIRPLIQVMQNDMAFYIVALSQKNARLFTASKFTISEISLDKETPTSFEEAMQYDAPRDQLQYKMISGSDGGNTAIYHGHTESDQENKNLYRYFRMLDNGISKAISDHDLPILLFGLDYLHPIYRDASDLANIVDFGVQKNTDELEIESIHAEAWAAIHQNLDLPVDQAIEDFKNLSGSEKSATDMKKIPLATANGQVDTLFVEKDDQMLGLVDLENQAVDLQPSKDRLSATELINFSIKHTLMNSGEVFVLDKESMPVHDSSAGVILRY
ncbi:MAG: hypothetical protein P8046_05430 [Anaerolineales bacterium]